MRTGRSLRLEHCTPSEYLSEACHDVLGVTAFGVSEPFKSAERDLPHAPHVPLAHVRAPVLATSEEVLEVWRANERTQPHSHGEVRYARGGDFLFGSVAVDEAQFASAARSHPRTTLEIATDLAYREMYATLAATANAHLVRVWNYIADINLDTRGLERYRQFNSARHEATLACGRAVTGSVPAASALGTASGSPLTVYFLASRRAPTFIENPRQVSAYRYPAQYGPRSPSFSRGTVIGAGSEATLFISGTASIVGHRTLHAGDLAAQTRETLVNIEALLDEAARRSGAEDLRLETLAYKVYVRDPNELPVIRGELESALGPKAAILYLKADICRPDLSVEIEAVGGGGWRPAA